MEDLGEIDINIQEEYKEEEIQNVFLKLFFNLIRLKQ